MKNSRILFLLFFGLIIGCKTETKKKDTPVQKVESKEHTTPEKIALAHGFENWKNVNEVKFTFNVDREDSHFERKWIWFPKTKNVTHITSKDTITYNRSDMDSVAFKVNAGFINDRYWLFAPFNLMWDKNSYDYFEVENDSAPIAKIPMNRLTITYGSEGGYTPGDAYDFYFEDDYVLKEWVFRKANQEEPSMITTWENYLDTMGLKLARDHRNDLGDFKLYFDGVEIKTEN
ncbi:hypothetical protein [Croceivirga thetidis]|uniref:Uncharacterized protein n=1 Tax=Croceivirga thetidis TaxID=2721623 RepID=A0ABX1GKB4_9FLAO|nr:hypothetical protein [Croceivirga thetidis]NKI30313.1 hypothetical protein [Croceivirga thetidis]